MQDILRKCEQNATDHERYTDHYNDATRWLQGACDKYAIVATLGTSRDDIEQKQTVTQELSQDKDTGYAKLTQAVESGEKLYPHTASTGREAIRQEVRSLKQDWDALFDNVMSEQRHLEVSLVQWTSFQESSHQLEAWLSGMEAQLKGDLPLVATLEEKKAQLQTYRVRQKHPPPKWYTG